MAKVDINRVAEVMKKCEASPALLRAVIEELNLLAQPEDEKEPAVKKQFVFVLSDPDGRMPKCDFVGWVLQIPETESVATTQDRIFRSAYDFNATKKGRLLPVKTVGEAIENVPAKLFKEADVWVKTKTPVLVLRTDNEIPNTNNTEKLPFTRLSRVGPMALEKAFQKTLNGLGDDASVTITHEGKGVKIDKDGAHPI